MPPDTMIIVMPMAPSATITVWARTMRRLRTDRYWSGASLISAKTPITSTRPISGARATSSRPQREPAVVSAANGRLHHRFGGPLVDGAGRRQAAPRHHRERMADAEQLGQVGADHHDPGAAPGAVDDGAIDLHLAADVDALGRLVEQQHVGMLVQQPRQ